MIGKKLIITEEERKEIKTLYGLIREQEAAQKNPELTLDLSGTFGSGKYKLPEKADRVDDLINKISVGTNYKFYVDPSVGTNFGSVNLGIRIIELNGQTIYKESMVAHLIGGSIFIAFCILTALLFKYVKRKKNVI